MMERSSKILRDGTILSSHCSKCNQTTDHVYRPEKLKKLQCLRCNDLLSDGWNIFPAKCPKCGADNMILRPGTCVCSGECSKNVF